MSGDTPDDPFIWPIDVSSKLRHVLQAVDGNLPRFINPVIYTTQAYTPAKGQTFTVRISETKP